MIACYLILVSASLLMGEFVGWIGVNLYHTQCSQTVWSLGLVVITLYVYSTMIVPASLLLMHVGSDRIHKYPYYRNRSRL